MKSISIDVRFEDPMKEIEKIVKSQDVKNVSVSKRFDGAYVTLSVDDKYDANNVKRDLIKSLERSGYKAR